MTVTAERSCASADTAQMEQNKKTVMALYDAALNKLDFEEASKYLGPRYTQHNPNAKDGPEGLMGFITFLKEKYPQTHSEIKKIFADGDYVFVHVHAVREPGTRGFSGWPWRLARWQPMHARTVVPLPRATTCGTGGCSSGNQSGGAIGSSIWACV